MSSVAAKTVALWVLASYTINAFYIFPRLFVTSPEKGCGKSTLLDLIECLAQKPIVASTITASSLFRLIATAQPTMLLDEADAYLRNKEDMRAIINAGHKRNGMVFKSAGIQHGPREFSVYAPVVIASIGDQSTTVEARSIRIPMQRKLPNQNVKDFRRDRAPQLEELARKCARWAQDHFSDLAAANVDVPAEIHNRVADNWRPLLTVADAAGGKWPKRARAVASKMSQQESSQSHGIQALADIRDIFGIKGEAIFSKDLAAEMIKIEGRPWAEFQHSKPLTPNALARLLAPFKIAPSDIRIGKRNTSGYQRRWFDAVFARYLTP